MIGAALERAKLAPERIDEVFMGNVLPAGQGQAPARQAARGAGLPDATGATTVNKVCGSGMKATMLAHDMILAGSAAIVLCRRHGVHDQRALPAGQGARRLPRRPRPHPRPHDARRAGGRLRGRPLHGRFRRGHRAGLPVHPRGPGRLRHGDADPRPQGRSRAAPSRPRSRRSPWPERAATARGRQ